MMSPLKVRKGYYDAEEGQIHYRYLSASIKDESKLPVLLLHMSACSSFYYKEMIQRFSTAGHDCYAPDMPGFGASYDPASQPASIKYYVDVFMLLVEHVGIKGKFHVLGHHSGASIAIEMAALHSDRVATVSVCGTAFCTSEEQQEFVRSEIHMYNKPVIDGSHLMKVWNYLLPQGGWDPIDLHTQALDALRAYTGRLQIYTCVFSQPILETVKLVKCPLLAMSSERDSLYPYIGRAQEALPDAEIKVVGGVDFEVMRDAKGVTNAMLEFMAKR